MKILFLIPPQELNPQKEHVDRVYGCNYGYDYKPPIHMLSAATTLKNAGHEVSFVDSPAEGLRAGALERVVRESQPDMVCFFSVYLSHEEDREAARLAAEWLPETWNVFMGTHATWKPEQYLRRERDIVVRGEPEGTLVDVARAVETAGNPGGVKGVSRLSGGEMRHEPPRELMNADDLPLPDRAMLKGSYAINRMNVHPATTMCTSRGCPYRCTFCAPNAADQAVELEHKRHGLKHPPFRYKSEERVIEEFRAIAGLNIRGIEIADNLFIFKKERTIKICGAIAPLGLKWLCCSRADKLQDEESIAAMARAGCTMVYIGSESFCQEILDDINKQIGVGQIRSAVEKLRRHRIEPEVSVMLGASPLETPGTVRRSMRAARSLGTRFTHYSIALPFPNTKLYDLARENGWLRNGEFEPVDNARHSIINLPHLKAEQLEHILKNAYLRQYFNPLNIWSQLKKIRSLKDFEEKAKVPLRFLRFYFSNNTNKPQSARKNASGGVLR